MIRRDVFRFALPVFHFSFFPFPSGPLPSPPPEYRRREPSSFSLTSFSVLLSRMTSTEPTTTAIPPKMNVKLLDLTAQYLPLRNEIRRAIDEVCDAQALILGPHVEKFERHLAEYCGT